MIPLTLMLSLTIAVLMAWSCALSMVADGYISPSITDEKREAARRDKYNAFAAAAFLFGCLLLGSWLA